MCFLSPFISFLHDGTAVTGKLYLLGFRLMPLIKGQNICQENEGIPNLGKDDKASDVEECLN